MTESQSDVKPVENLNDAADSWTTDNVQDLQEGKLRTTGKYGPYMREFDFEDKKTGESKHVKNLYVFVESAKKILPVKANKYSQTELRKLSPSGDFAKMDGKSVVFVITVGGTGPYIVLKPKGKVD